MFTELGVSIHERGNPKELTTRILDKVSACIINPSKDPRGMSVNMLGVKLGSIPVITEGRLTHHPHTTSYIYFYEAPTIEDPLQIKGIAIDGREITEYEYRHGQSDSRTMKKTSLTVAWELFTQINNRLPIQFPRV